MKARWLILALLAGLAVPFIVPALAANQSVTARNNFFDPEKVAVKPNEKVTFTNTPGGLHNVKFEDGNFEQPPEPSTLPWSHERTFSTPGEYRYYCEAHGGSGMSGTVYVNDAGTVPTQTQTQPTNTTPTNTNTNTTPTTTQPPPDTTQPGVSSLRATASSFCTRRSRTCRRPGLRFRLELSEAAELRGVVRLVRRARQSATRRSFVRSGTPGTNVIRVSARRLVPGRYRLTLRATDGAGNTSPPARLSFRVRR